MEYMTTDNKNSSSQHDAKLPVSRRSYSNVYVWAIVENIVTVVVTAALFMFTKSGWVFLLLLNLNQFKSRKNGS